MFDGNFNFEYFEVIYSKVSYLRVEKKRLITPHKAITHKLTCFTDFSLITSLTSRQTYSVDMGTLVYVTTVSAYSIAVVTK